MLRRRGFLTAAGAWSAARAAPAWGDDAPRRPRVAAIFTVLRFRSHAYNILENFLAPYPFCGQLVDPGVDVVSLYADQFPEDDMAREVARRFDLPLCSSIDEAMCAGGRELAVDAALLIGEHGDYPFNSRGQQLYPRKRFFDEAVASMRRAGRYVPVFNDKHLSWSWAEAEEMFRTCRRHRIPLLAGSSVPLAQRRPPLDLPPEAELEEAVAVHGGGLETYDFHGLELLQSFVETRRGGETGVARIELLTGDRFDAARRAGRWSAALEQAALRAERQMQARRQPRPTTGVFAAPQPPREPPAAPRPPRPEGPHAILVTYRDGLKATVLRVGSDSNRWNFACRVKGDPAPRATALFNSPWGNRGLFKALSHAIQHLFVRRQEPYPADRTLLTTGAVEAVMRSYESGGAVDTPNLSLAYQAPDSSAFREDGRSWKIITDTSPQPTEFLPGRP